MSEILVYIIILVVSILSGMFCGWLGILVAKKISGNKY
jgi:hypothetical protein